MCDYVIVSGYVWAHAQALHGQSLPARCMDGAREHWLGAAEALEDLQQLLALRMHPCWPAAQQLLPPASE